MSLAALEAQVARDLARIDHPSARWLEQRTAPDGSAALDVLIVGGGQSGVAVAFGLQRAKVDNVLVIDAAARGAEGPWRSYARMRTLRSPKEFTGPDLDIPSLTYQSWHEARFGTADWESLGLIARERWADYLLWVRDVTGVRVRNGVAMTGVRSEAGLLAVEVEEGGRRSELWTRKLVLATGQDGLGRWWMPECLERLPAALRAHAADPIDFAALRGKDVAVVGLGASALDNAASALEAGAATVTVLCRRAEPQLVQPYRWVTFAGFLRHLGELDDRWRWRFMASVLGRREGFPQATWDRCAQWPNFALRTGMPIEDAAAEGGRVRLRAGGEAVTADFVIAGTGMDIDLAHRPELAAIAPHVASWGDRYTPPPAERDARLARFPYLGADWSLQEREPGRLPWLADIHVFSIASTMSFGPSGSSINAMTTAVPRLVHGVTGGLFRADLDRHWASFEAYDVRQAVLG